MLQKFTSIFIALLLTVFLLGFPRGGYTEIPDFKYTLFLLICGGYVIAVFVLRVMYVITATQPLGKIKERVYGLQLPVKFLFLFLIFTIISSILSVYPETFRGAFRQEGVLTIGIYVLSCFFVATYFKPHKWMLWVLGTSIVLVSALAFVQLTGANPFTLYPEGHNYYGAGVYYSAEFLSTIGNAGLLAGFMSLVVGIMAMALIKFENKERWALAIPFFLAVLLIFSKGIDAAVVALLAGFVIMVPVAITSQKTLVNTLIVLAIIVSAFSLSRILIFQDGPILFAQVRIIFIIAVAFILLLAVFVSKISLFEKISAQKYRRGALGLIIGSTFFAFMALMQYGGDSGWIYEASQVLRGNWDDTFGTRRIFIWRNILEGMQLQTLLFGTGPDTLGFWNIEPFSRYLEHLGFTLVTIIDAAHNEFLHILAMNGLLALMSYLGALGAAAVTWIQKPENPLSAVSGAGVLFYAIQSFFGISQFIVAPFFWVCLGILLFSQRSQNL